MQQPQLILVAGMFRSGSTWLYNVVRVYLENNFPDNVYGCFVTDYDQQNQCCYHVVKSHEFSTELSNKASLIVLSERDYKDIAKSMSRFHSMQYTAEDMMPLNEYYHRYAEYAQKSVKLPYTDIMYSIDGEPVGKYYAAGLVIHRLMKANVIETKLLVKEDIIRLVEQVETLPQPEGSVDYADPITLIHPNHR